MDAVDRYIAYYFRLIKAGLILLLVFEALSMLSYLMPSLWDGAGRLLTIR